MARRGPCYGNSLGRMLLSELPQAAAPALPMLVASLASSPSALAPPYLPASLPRLVLRRPHFLLAQWQLAYVDRGLACRWLGPGLYSRMEATNFRQHHDAATSSWRQDHAT